MFLLIFRSTCIYTNQALLLHCERFSNSLLEYSSDQMRLLQLAFIVALSSGLAAIFIYTTNLSDFCKCIMCIYAFILYCLPWKESVLFSLMVELIWCTDGPHQLSDEDLEAFRSLQRGFQKCVVSFPLRNFFLFFCFFL